MDKIAVLCYIYNEVTHMECYFGLGTNCSDKISKDYIAVNNFGYYKNIDKEINTLRLKGRNDYQIIYIEKGEGNFLIGETFINLKAGTVVIYRPGERQVYNFSKDKLSSFYWIHFSGTEIGKILSNLKLNENIFTIHDNFIFSHEIKKMADFTTEEPYIQNTFLSGRLLIILSKLKKSQNTNKSKISKAIELINKDTKNELSNTDYAKLLNMSEYHFIRKFKKETGLSPHKYKTKRIISAAENLLLDTDLNISEIAELVGFSDSLYFSRIFKKETGISPGKYRK